MNLAKLNNRNGRSFLEIQRTQLARSSSTVFAVHLILYSVFDWKRFRIPINDQSIHEKLSFHSLHNNVYYRWISSHFSCKQNSKHKNAELSILAREDLTPKNPLERERRLEIQRRIEATKMETTSANSGAEGRLLNEFRMLKYFKSKWKWLWIISLNMWANIAVTKHVLLADEFIP